MSGRRPLPTPPPAPTPASCRSSATSARRGRRYLAVFHPEARFEDTEVVTEAGGSRFRTKGRRLLEAGWRGPAFGDEPAEPERKGDEEPEQTLPRIDDGERGTCTSAEVLEK